MIDDYSYIDCFGIIIEETSIKDDGNPLGFMSFTIMTEGLSAFTTFTVKTHDRMKGKTWASLKKGECVYIEGYYYFDTIYPESILRIKACKNISFARRFLVTNSLSHKIYMKGRVRNNTITTEVNIKGHIPTGYTDTRCRYKIEAGNGNNKSFILKKKGDTLYPIF